MAMTVIPLQSGSSGNCVYVEAGGARLLFDAGISGIQAEERLAATGRDIRQVDGVIISHDHADHVRNAGVLQRKYGLPVHITPRTLAAASTHCSLGKLSDIRPFSSSGLIKINDAVIQAIPTPHDSEDGAVFVIAAGGRRLGIMTDLGHVFGDLIATVATLDAVLLESNYDPDMLATGPYPAHLKKRIRGPRGHISNQEAAGILRRAAEGGRLRWACLAHLSGENNCPDVALRTHRAEGAPGLPLHVTDRAAATPPMMI